MLTPDRMTPDDASPAPDLPARRILARSHLRPVSAALGLVAAGQAVADLRARRAPLRGPALPLALAAGWCALTDATAPRPVLSYTRGLRRDTGTGTKVPPAGLWTVTLTNAGTAPARVSAVCYFGRRDDGREVVATHDARELGRLFSDCGADDTDYLLLRLVPGWSLGPGASETLCELPPEVAIHFTSLGVTLTVCERFGGRWEYRVEAIPPHRLPVGVFLAAAPGPVPDFD